MTDPDPPFRGELLVDGDGPGDGRGDGRGRTTVLLAHGAGAGMETPWMSTLAAALAGQGLRVARFEFAYMAARRIGAPRRPPPPVARLEAEYRAVISALAGDGPLVIGGKSMGGRVASLVADDAPVPVLGLLCFGYPFHPRGKPGTLRTAHLAGLATPTLICQGSRDPLGTRAEVAGYDLSDRIDLHWFEDGDHDLKPRRRVTGLTLGDHLAAAAAALASAIGAWARAAGAPHRG